MTNETNFDEIDEETIHMYDIVLKENDLIINKPIKIKFFDVRVISKFLDDGYAIHNKLFFAYIKCDSPNIEISDGF
jgi:hypothetical protein